MGFVILAVTLPNCISRLSKAHGAIYNAVHLMVDVTTALAAAPGEFVLYDTSRQLETPCP